MKERKNKSQIKRESIELHKLGEQLAQLDEHQLNGLNPPERLLDALKAAKRITSHGARKRHFQHIAGIIRSMEIEALTGLRSSLANLKQISDSKKVQFHHIEKWRDRLTSDEPDVLTLFLNEHHCNDVQQLRQAIKHAHKDRHEQIERGHSKALFRLLKQIIECQ